MDDGNIGAKYWIEITKFVDRIKIIGSGKGSEIRGGANTFNKGKRK